MKALFTTTDSVANKVSYYHLACFVMLLPFDFFYSQLVLISFAVHTLIHLKKERLQLLASKATVLPLSIFLLSLVSIIYSTDKKEGLSIAGRQTAILLIPLLFTLNELDFKKYKIPLLKIFAFTCTITIIYLYANAIYTIRYFHLPINSLFSIAFINHNFSLPIELHATYLSMYSALSAFICLFVLSKERRQNNKILYLICIIILFAGILQLASRAVFAGIAIIIPAGIAFFFIGAKKRMAFLGIAIVVIVCTSFIIAKVDAFKLRYVSELNNDLTQAAINSEVLEPRIARWQLAVDLIKQSPVVGYGTGSEKELMKQQYFEHKLYISYLKEFNVHSQYLSFLLRTGIIGLVLYFLLLYYGFSIAVKKKDVLFFSFMALIAVVSVSENILDVNKGIFFYSFFLSFFLQAHNAKIFYAGNRNMV